MVATTRSPACAASAGVAARACSPSSVTSSVRVSPGPVPLALSVKAAATLDCLNIALDHWTASDGQLDLVDLLDEAFTALAPR